MSITFVANDNGAGGSKLFATDGQKSYTRSLVAVDEVSAFQTGYTVTPSYVLTYISGTATALRGQSFVAGDKVSRLRLKTETVFQDKSKKVDNALPLLLWSLVNNKIVGPGESHVVTTMSHHNPGVSGAQLRSNIEGIHFLRAGDGNEYRIQIKFAPAGVVAEGSAVMPADELPAGSMGFSRIDFGELTVMLSECDQHGDTYGSPRASGEGVGYLVNMIAVSPEFTALNYGIEGDRVAITNALVEASTRPEGHALGRKILYRFDNEAKDITLAYKACLLKWLKMVMAPALGSLSQYKGLDYRVIAIGGGVNLPGIKKLLVKNGIQPYEGDPVFANAESMFLKHLAPLSADMFKFRPFNEEIAALSSELNSEALRKKAKQVLKAERASDKNSGKNEQASACYSKSRTNEQRAQIARIAIVATNPSVSEPTALSASPAEA